ncbi:hypothetical protein MKW92_021657, partial [Papaver armeniacum]
YLTRANKDLKINDLHTHGPAATANFFMCPPKSKQQIQEEEEDDDDDNFSDSSLSDDHTATSESRIDNYVAKDRVRKANEPSKFHPKSNLLSKYVSWSSKPSIVEILVLKSEKDRKGYHYLNIYGFYKKVTGVGGYGVILRDPCGKPVVASASVQQNGKSYFYHVLDGAIFGLFNSRRTRNRFARYRCGACKTCLSILFPLLKEIIDVRIKIMSKSHYFFLNYEMKTAKATLRLKTIRPIDVDEELKMILLKMLVLVHGGTLNTLSTPVKKMVK